MGSDFTNFDAGCHGPVPLRGLFRGQLVRLSGGIALGIAKHLTHGQLDDVGAGSMVGHAPAVTDADTGRGAELLGALDSSIFQKHTILLTPALQRSTVQAVTSW